MISGWQWPDDAAIASFTHAIELTDFERAQVRSYLEKQGVISPIAEPLRKEDEELVRVCYELTKGHPLVLGLAVTFFKQLSDSERNATILLTKRPLVDEQARVQFLEERLLSRLPEPYRTLLERGPILRYFDQETLQILLNVETEGAAHAPIKLADRTYVQFLAYPFISRESTSGNELSLSQPTFHELIRRVRLGALRNHFQTKEQLHRAMAEYYGKQVEAERKQRAGQESVDSKYTSRNISVKDSHAEWLAEIPEQEFRAILEGLYHRLQVRDLQAAAWEEWKELTARAVDMWRRLQAGPLLELIEQLVEEGEPYLGKTSKAFGLYLIWYSRFLEQEARWDEAQTTLKEAAKVLEQVGDPADIALSLNNIGAIYNTQGKLEQALNCFEQARALFEQVGDPADIALSLNNIGAIYRKQGKLEQALNYYERARALFEQVGNPADIALSLNNIGYVYQMQVKLEQAIEHYARSLHLYESLGKGFESDVAHELESSASCYAQLGEYQKSLIYERRAQDIRKTM
jgi:tetratricopeptide (TPR) repeat protein